MALPFGRDSEVDGTLFKELERSLQARDQLGQTATVADPLEAVDALPDVYFGVLEDYGMICLVYTLR